MKQDRTAICNIISEMLDSPDEHGIYPTSVAYEKLEQYIESVRWGAVGWMYGYACLELDDGEDIRLKDVPEILKRFMLSLDMEIDEREQPADVSRYSMLDDK